MSWRPDIIVTGDWPSDHRLLVEVSLQGDADALETTLMRHLTDYNCSFGALITAREIRLIKDTGRYVGTTTYERISARPLPEELRVRATAEATLVRAVQDWLERLVAHGAGIVDDPMLAAILRDEVIPRLRGADINAGQRPRSDVALAR